MVLKNRPNKLKVNVTKDKYKLLNISLSFFSPFIYIHELQNFVLYASSTKIYIKILRSHMC